MNDIILKLVPSLRARRLPDGRVVLTQKFVEGVQQFCRNWAGRVHVYLQISESQYSNLDEITVDPKKLPFRASLVTSRQLEEALVADCDAVAVLSLDDCTQSRLGTLCRQHDIPCAYIAEYSLATRRQIVDAGTRNPLLRVRRKLWEAAEERKRRHAVAQAEGIQCNGTPTYQDYRQLSPDALLYFDTRVSADLMPRESDILNRFRDRRAGGPLRLLFSGRLVASKGAAHLVEVAKKLREQNLDFHFFVCGDGDLRESLESRIVAEHLSGHVTMKGVLDFRTELVPFATRHVDLFVCCHPQGDPSCTYLETMSCGIPIAGYANEAFEGIVRHSGCGWTVPVNQPGALAQRIIEISRTPDALLEMSLDSLRFAGEHTFDQTFSRRIQHLQSLAERAGKTTAVSF